MFRVIVFNTSMMIAFLGMMVIAGAGGDSGQGFLGQFFGGVLMTSVSILVAFFTRPQEVKAG